MKKYVLALSTESRFRSWTEFVGYWNGRVYYNKIEEESYAGTFDDPQHEKVKKYTTRKRAENGVKKFHGKFVGYAVEISEIEYNQ